MSRFVVSCSRFLNRTALRSCWYRSRALRVFGVSLIGMAVPALAQSISFIDVSAEAAIATQGSGYGVSVHDFDADGWDDVLITSSRGRSKLFRNRGDATFEDVTEQVGLASIGAFLVGLWGDVDGDGLSDLFLGGRKDNRLFRNRGDGTFEESVNSGIAAGLATASAAFGDFDGDGGIDLFMAVEGAADVLYRNTKGGGATLFEDVSGRAGIGGSAATVPMQATWVDYDHDGDLDLFCVHDGREISRLYRNGGFLPLINVATGARITGYPDGVCCNMGTAWGDFDGDGLLDAYVTRIGTGGLFRNNGNSTFTDVAEERGASRNGMSWGVVFGDFDNDGDQDLFIVGTSGYDHTPTLLYENTDGYFSETGIQAGASYRLDARGLATGDFNRDGLLDLIIAAEDGGNRLLLNSSAAEGRWLKLNLTGRESNAMAIGARVEIRTGGKTFVRTVSGGDSFVSQSSSTLHVGLGDDAAVDTLRIHWGGGRTQVETNLTSGRTHSLVESIQASSREADEVPARQQLSTSYPNPFASTTTITFNVAKPGRVSIEVFDALGRRVAVLVDGVWPAGTHSARFDARQLESGTYYYRLTTGTSVELKQMALIR